MTQNNFSNDPLREFYQQRWALNHGDTDKKETPEFWDERAADFAAKAHSEEASKESEEFLNRFVWNKNETVLDVAAGPGTFAVPLAKKVASVTATDFSQAMLDQLKIKAQSENITNVKTIQGCWLEMKQPEIHDTVLCLNSLGVISTDSQHCSRLEDTLKKLAGACGKRLIVLIPHADSPLEPDLRKNLGLEEVSMERKRIAVLYYAMVDCGMLPSLQIIKRPFRWTFADENEACETLLLKSGVSNSEKHKSTMAEYLSTRLKRESSGRLSLAYEVSQALYIWEK